MNGKSRICVVRVQTIFLYGVEGITIDGTALACVRNREGTLLATLVWRNNNRMGLGRLLTLYIHWVRAKDVYLSLAPRSQPGAQFVVQEQSCVTGGSQSFVDVEAGLPGS
eukprot:333034-Pyramimonas_sp.AAC.1